MERMPSLLPPVASKSYASCVPAAPPSPSPSSVLVPQLRAEAAVPQSHPLASVPLGQFAPVTTVLVRGKPRPKIVSGTPATTFPAYMGTILLLGKAPDICQSARSLFGS